MSCKVCKAALFGPCMLLKWKIWFPMRSAHKAALFDPCMALFAAHRPTGLRSPCK